ncbi:WD40 repeat protein [Spironucleus salmonicida]|uniref:WD domain, G-beta repeat-containing protein n=1 Tax=Spironucleus salmonicida TaxID=348837 RepID=V6LJ21_9EUKA|nr:WD40 repeat protein [Spironucleus salmonicida]|eukprot:EST44572.1 WD domain, G-beta repeat-containing protein [Spironucleus salmonicida]
MQYSVNAKIVSQLQDGQMTYVGTSSGAIHCMNWCTTEFEKAFFSHNGPISALTMYQNTITSGGWDRKVIIHKDPQIIISGFNDAIKSVLGVKNFLFVGTADGFLEKYDENQKRLISKQTNKRFIDCIIELPNNLIATAGSDRQIRVYDHDLNEKSKLELINSVKCIKYVDELLFVSCAEKLIRVYELPDLISGRSHGIPDFTEIFQQSLQDWGLDLDVTTDWKSKGIFVACADKTLKCVKRESVDIVPSGAGDIVQGVNIVKNLIKIEAKEKECDMIVYSCHDGYIRRIFLNSSDRQFFVPDAKVEDKSISLDDSDFEDEEVKKIQQQRLKAMLKNQVQE